MRRFVRFVRIWQPVYEGDDPPPPPPPPGGGNPDPKLNTFTQEQVNKMLADDRRKHKEQQTKLLEEVEALKAKSSLTAKEREEHEARMDELRKQALTAEELKKEEVARVQKELQLKLDTAAKERDSWRTRFSNETIQRAIVDAAASQDAFVPAQIVAILQPKTRLVEALDDDGKPTGEYTPKVTFDDTKEGKSVTLELSPKDAVKRMSEMDDYLNLFKGKGSGGIGGTNRGSGGSGGSMTAVEAAKTLSPAAYAEWRSKHGLDTQ